MPKVFFLLVAVSLLAVSPLSAGSIALTFTGGTTYGYVTDPMPNTIGWEFQLSAPVIVTSLGFYDVGGDGLIADHEVAIWDTSTQVQVADATVVNADPLDLGYRWISISPILLAAGTYRIGSEVAVSGQATDDFYYSTADTLTTYGPITYDGGVYSLGAFAYPDTIGYTNNGRFGPNFQFDATVPEPGTAGIVLFGLLTAAALRRRRG